MTQMLMFSCLAFSKYIYKKWTFTERKGRQSLYYQPSMCCFLKAFFQGLCALLLCKRGLCHLLLQKQPSNVLIWARSAFLKLGYAWRHPRRTSAFWGQGNGLISPANLIRAQKLNGLVITYHHQGWLGLLWRKRHRQTTSPHFLP